MTFGASARKVYGDVRLKFDDVNLLDQIVLVNPLERDVVRDEINNRTSFGAPINVAESLGNSSAAALLAARELAQTLQSPHENGQKRVVLILAYDHLDRYGEPVPFHEFANNPHSTRPITSSSRLGLSNPAQRSMLPPGSGWSQQRAATLDALPTSIVDAYYGPVGRILANASLG